MQFTEDRLSTLQFAEAEKAAGDGTIGGTMGTPLDDGGAMTMTRNIKADYCVHELKRAAASLSDFDDDSTGQHSQ